MYRQEMKMQAAEVLEQMISFSLIRFSFYV